MAKGSPHLASYDAPDTHGDNFAHAKDSPSQDVLVHDPKIRAIHIYMQVVTEEALYIRSAISDGVTILPLYVCVCFGCSAEARLGVTVSGYQSMYTDGIARDPRPCRATSANCRKDLTYLPSVAVDMIRNILAKSVNPLATFLYKGLEFYNHFEKTMMQVEFRICWSCCHSYNTLTKIMPLCW